MNVISLWRLNLSVGYHRLVPVGHTCLMNDALVDRVREWISDARKIVVLTGAGISTDSGIPDFRGPNGIWTKNPAAEKASTIHHYLADREIRKVAWQTRVTSPAWDARPNEGHRAIAELERRGKLHALITQNVDGLHQRAGNSEAKVIEVHGTMRWSSLLELRRPAADATDPRPSEGRSGRSAVSGLRRHPEE